MAAPADRNMQDYSGEWVMNKTLSDPTDPIFKLQGLSWVTRTAIYYATVTLQAHSYTSPNPEDSSKAILHIDIDQIATGGLKGTSEKRIADWQPREHQDHIFGSCEGRSRMIRGSKDKKDDDASGKVKPDVVPETKIGGNGVDDEIIRRFLRGEVKADGVTEEKAGEGDAGWAVDHGVGEGILTQGDGDDGLWLHSWVVNKDETGGWTAEQVWGFEIIDGQRYHTRRVVVAKDGTYEMARLVYDWIKYREEEEEKEEEETSQ